MWGFTRSVIWKWKPVCNWRLIHMQPVISEAGLNKCILNVNQYFILTWVQIHNFCHNVTDGYSCIMMILISVFSNGSMNIVGIYCCAHLHSCWRRMLSHVYPSYWSIEYVIFYVTCLYRVGPHVQLLFTTLLNLNHLFIQDNVLT